MTDIQSAIAAYIAALEAGEAEAKGFDAHNPYMESLSLAGRMWAAAERHDVNELAALVNEEERVLGWTMLVGAHGAAAHAAFHELARRVRAARLADRPPAW